jgi:4-hydroxybenzoate polyprenyltransferase
MNDASPSLPPPPKPRGWLSFARMVLVLIVTVANAASSIVMVGPQILVIAPSALLLGLVFASRRSPWSLVCFGYPFTFGLISAWIGCTEMPGYERTTAFPASLAIGLAGCGLIATGLWKVLRGQNRSEAGQGGF